MLEKKEVAAKGLWRWMDGLLKGLCIASLQGHFPFAIFRAIGGSKSADPILFVQRGNSGKSTFKKYNMKCRIAAALWRRKKYPSFCRKTYYAPLLVAMPS
mmetsp:Transcript_20273/g.34855  ORF Transcript_20273/g.34855 Transcript_20273/m.34855 type:complete len:100 (+) Transcript_20273:663-962(+)